MKASCSTNLVSKTVTLVGVKRDGITTKRDAMRGIPPRILPSIKRRQKSFYPVHRETESDVADHKGVKVTTYKATIPSSAKSIVGGNNTIHYTEEAPNNDGGGCVAWKR